MHPARHTNNSMPKAIIFIAVPLFAFVRSRLVHTYITPQCIHSRAAESRAEFLQGLCVCKELILHVNGQRIKF